MRATPKPERIACHSWLKPIRSQGTCRRWRHPSPPVPFLKVRPVGQFTTRPRLAPAGGDLLCGCRALAALVSSRYLDRAISKWRIGLAKSNANTTRTTIAALGNVTASPNNMAKAVNTNMRDRSVNWKCLRFRTCLPSSSLAVPSSCSSGSTSARSSALIVTCAYAGSIGFSSDREPIHDPDW